MSILQLDMNYCPEPIFSGVFFHFIPSKTDGKRSEMGQVDSFTNGVFRLQRSEEKGNKKGEKGEPLSKQGKTFC